MQNARSEVEPVATSIPLPPMLTCVASGLALAFTPVLVWRMTTGKWVCLQQPETFYYLQIAAQSYYNHLWYVSDPTIPNGVIFYPWLQFIPPVFLVPHFWTEYFLSCLDLVVRRLGGSRCGSLLVILAISPPFVAARWTDYILPVRY